MKIQVSKTMAAYIRKWVVKFHGIDCVKRVRFELVPLSYYTRCVNSFAREDMFFRYDCEPQYFGEPLVKVIRIIYTDECYAMDKFITTGELHYMIKDYSHNHTVDEADLINALVDYIAI